MSDITISAGSIPNYHHSGTTHTLRVRVSASFSASDGSLVENGESFYQEVSLSVVGSTASYSSFTLKSTRDGVNLQDCSYSFKITVDGDEKQNLSIDGETQFIVPASPSTQSLSDLATSTRAYHNVRSRNLPEGYLTQSQSDARYVTQTTATASYQPLDEDLTVWAGKTAPSGVVVGTTDSQTLTNKTLTAPVIGSPSGLVKADVGLGNVDNTSDATKNAAAVTLTNKTIDSPALINTPTTPTAASGTSTTQVASTAYVVTEIAARLALADALRYRGAIDCSANPNYPAADAGDTYRVSVAGKIGGASGVNVEAGDLLMCHVDSSASGTQAGVGANWDVIQVNIDGAVTLTGSQTLTNKTIALGSNTISGTTAQFNTALSDGDFATLAGSEVLTNKTLTTPALGVASATSISFGGTALSTYAESTYTPALTFGGGSTGITYADRVGRYTQVGDLVFFSVKFSLTNKGSSVGAAAVSLPVAASGTTNYLQALTAYCYGMTYTGTAFGIIDPTAPTAVNLDVNNNGGSATLDDTNFSNTSTVIVTGVYRTN